MKVDTITLTLFLIGSMPAAFGDTVAGAATASVPVAEVTEVPERFDGRTLAVSGYLRPHVLYLFPSRQLAENQAWATALIVGDDPGAGIRDSACPGRRVSITGTVRELDPNVYGLTDITTIRLESDGTVCWPASP